MKVLPPAALLLVVVAACAPASPTPPVSAAPPAGSPAPAASLPPAGSPAPVPTADPIAHPTPLPDLEVLCRAQGNRPDVSCDELTQQTLAAVAGLPRAVAAVGMSAYGFPCGVPIPQAPSDEPCDVDVDDGPVAWVAFDGTPTIAAIRFTGADGVVDATVVAFGETAMSIGMLLEAANPTPSRSPVPSMPADVPSPVLVLPSGARVKVALRGGCGSVAYGADFQGSDQCGPMMFDGALGVKAVRVAPGARLVLGMGGGWRLGADPRLIVPWTIRIASTARLAGQEEHNLGFPAGIGRVLDDGTASHARIAVTAPTRPGDYLLQYDGPVSRDGWSFLEGTYYWHIRVR